MIQAIDKEVRKEVETAMQQAISDDVLPLEALYADIYANTGPLKIRGVLADETKEQPYLTTTDLLKKLGLPTKA